MLIGIVLLFLICQTPTAAYLIYMNVHQSKTRRQLNISLSERPIKFCWHCYAMIKFQLQETFSTLWSYLIHRLTSFCIVCYLESSGARLKSCFANARKSNKRQSCSLVAARLNLILTNTEYVGMRPSILLQEVWR